ncbi:COG0579 Predicted dehydrogenase [Candidatus Methylopumilus universalis]|uniref:L-2-hydroxyglutarate oxidase n=1 Tax=Candidatus Methylopumilus universalis TaxID=2588536 RepID=UPI003BEF1869
MSKKEDVVIVGGGIVGLASAFQILKSRPEINLTLIEKEKFVAQHQSGHNSGVIHSGLYYKSGSQKALNCLLGYKLILEFCEEYSIPYEICGKIVVATSDVEAIRLNVLYERGIANGLSGLKFVNTDEIRDIEPHCLGVRGLLVPQTGIVDYSLIAMKYEELLLKMGANILKGERVNDIKKNGSYFEVIGDSQSKVSKVVITCAGLYSDHLALKTDLNLPLRIIPFRGEYYKFKANAPKLVKNLIYPVPDPNLPFLGVHFTRMMNGQIECGPNAVFAFGRESYNKKDINFHETLDALKWPGFRILIKRYWRLGLFEYYRSFSKAAFVRSLQKLIPDVRADYLEEGHAGIRAQACDNEGNLLDDFDIRSYGKLLHICNAPSPAATASLAIGQKIANNAINLLSLK